MAEHLPAILGLGALCAVWVLFQRFIARVDPEIGADPHCGDGSCDQKLCKIEQLERERLGLEPESPAPPG